MCRLTLEKSQVKNSRSMTKILPSSFYQHDDVLSISSRLLGKYLMTNIDGVLTGGMIIETEAYKGPEDKASHAHNNRRTKRTEVMFHNGGIAYVYRCYGIHALFNVVTSLSGTPHAVLIRAIDPEIGIEKMLERRGKKSLDKTLASGPGTLTQSLGIDTVHNGVSLQGPLIWIEDRGIKIKEEEVEMSPRIGVDYAGEHAQLPWRFRVLKRP